MSVCACVCVCPRLFRNEMCVRVSSAEEKVSALASLKVFFFEHTPRAVFSSLPIHIDTGTEIPAITFDACFYTREMS